MMNAKQILPVITVMNASQIISIIHCVKVCINDCFFKGQYQFVFYQSQNVSVILMVQLLWNVEKTMVIVLAKRDSKALSVMKVCSK